MINVSHVTGSPACFGVTWWRAGSTMKLPPKQAGEPVTCDTLIMTKSSPYRLRDGHGARDTEVRESGPGEHRRDTRQRRAHPAATLVSLARYGVAKTTLEDVAKEAGCARATVYRYFGGKQDLVHAAVAHESRAGPRRHRRRRPTGRTLEDALVAMATTAAHELLEHDALQFVLAHEPELVLPGSRSTAATGSSRRPRPRSRRRSPGSFPRCRCRTCRALVHPGLPRPPGCRRQRPSP